MKPEHPELNDVLSRIQSRERRSHRMTVLYTLIPTTLGCALVIAVMAAVQQATVAKQKATLAEQAAIVAEQEARMQLQQAELDKQKVELDIEEARSAELQTQVEALILGPVQAYVRPGQFGGRLVNAQTVGQAHQVLQDFRNSQLASIRTKGIRDLLAKIDDAIPALSDDNRDEALPQPENPEEPGVIELLVLELNGEACREAWERDSRRLSLKTRNVLHEMLFDEAVAAATAIAEAETYVESLEHRERFLSLYWGELPLIEGNAVATAMVNFGRAMLKWTEDAQPDRDLLRTLAAGIESATEKELEELQRRDDAAPPS